MRKLIFSGRQSEQKTERRKWGADRGAFAAQATMAVLMYCGAYGILMEMFQDMYESVFWIGGILYAVYYIAAIIGGTIWLAYLWNKRRKTALAAHLFLTASIACQLCGIIYECLFGGDAVGFEGVLIFGVIPGAALLTEISMMVNYYRENSRFKSACIRFNCVIIGIGVFFYMILFLDINTAKPSENLYLLFLIGIKGTLLLVMWEESGRGWKSYMKKRVFILIMILGVIICQLEVLSTGRFFLDYWIRDMLGEYDTNITVANMREGGHGALSAYCDGEYYFYDKSRKAICNYGAGEPIVPTEGVPVQLAVSGKYIYYMTKDMLYQCDYSGREVASRFFEKEYLKGLYADGKNVYCECDYAMDTLGYAVYIFDADNISKAGDFEIMDEGWDKAVPFYEEGRVTIAEHKMKQIKGGWMIATGSLAAIKVEHGEDAVKVYTENINNGYFGIVMEGDNETVISYWDYIAGLWDGELYSTENGIIRMISPKKWEDYGKDLDPNLWYSVLTEDDDCLIVLLEHYRAIDGRSTSYGSVGQYVKGQILYIDLETKKLQHGIPIKRGQVVYMDKDKYAAVKNGKITFYQAADGKRIMTHKIKGYALRKDYRVELCYDKIFIFCGEELIDVVEI